MTIAAETYVAQAVWTGVETNMPTGFTAEKATDVHVKANGGTPAIITPLIQGVHYNVLIGLNNAIAIQPIATAMPTAPQTLTVWRDTPALQGVDFQDLQDFSADDHEKLHDRWARLLAELKGGLARTAQVPVGETVDPLPPAEERAGMVLGFDPITGELGPQPPAFINGVPVAGGGPFPLFADGDNGIVIRPIRSEDLPAAQVNGLGAVKAIAPVTGKALVGLDEGGAFILGDAGGGGGGAAATVTTLGTLKARLAIAHQFLTGLADGTGVLLAAQPSAADLVQGVFLENEATIGSNPYNILRAPGDPVDPQLRRIVLGGVADGHNMYLRASGFSYMGIDGVQYAAMSAAGTFNFIIDCNAPFNNIIKNLKTSMFSAGQVRELRTSLLTLWVRKDGSDANDGLTDSPSGAVLTIGRAMTLLSKYDMGGFAPIIRVRAGNYDEQVNLPTVVGATSATLIAQDGAATTSIATTGSAHCIQIGSVRTNWSVTGFKLATAVAGFSCVSCTSSFVILTNCEFGPAGGAHLFSTGAGASLVVAGSAYTISGGTGLHGLCTLNAVMTIGGKAVTLLGAPTFSQHFLRAESSSVITANAMTFSGSAIGTRYQVAGNSLINTGTGAPGVPPDQHYFPGNVDDPNPLVFGGQYQ